MAQLYRIRFNAFNTRKKRRETSMKKLAADLKTVNKDIQSLAKKLERLSLTADKLMKAEAGKQAKKKPAAKKRPAKRAKAAPAKAPAKKTAPKAAKKPAAEKAPRAKTPTSQVLNLMKRYKKGVTIAKLKERSGLSDKQISNILHRASKSGRIARVSRGVYTLA